MYVCIYIYIYIYPCPAPIGRAEPLSTRWKFPGWGMGGLVRTAAAWMHVIDRGPSTSLVILTLRILGLAPESRLTSQHATGLVLWTTCQELLGGLCCSSVLLAQERAEHGSEMHGNMSGESEICRIVKISAMYVCTHSLEPERQS